MTPKLSVRKPPIHTVSRGVCIGGRERGSRSGSLARRRWGPSDPKAGLGPGAHPAAGARPLRVAAWVPSQSGGHSPPSECLEKTEQKPHALWDTPSFPQHPTGQGESCSRREGLREGVKPRGDHRSHLEPAATPGPSDPPAGGSCPATRPVVSRAVLSVSEGFSETAGNGTVWRGDVPGGSASHTGRTQSLGRSGSCGPGSRLRRDTHTRPSRCLGTHSGCAGGHRRHSWTHT